MVTREYQCTYMHPTTIEQTRFCSCSGLLLKNMVYRHAYDPIKGAKTLMCPDICYHKEDQKGEA